MEYLDRAKPSLKADVQLLSMFLLRLIEGQCVPDRKLNIETWSECEAVEHSIGGLCARKQNVIKHVE